VSSAGLQSTGYAYIDTRRAGSNRAQGAARMNAATSSAMIERAGRALIDAAPAPAKVILFGSHARGEAGDGSDFDFLVIEETVPDRLAEAVRLRDALGDFNAPVDVIVMDAALAERRAKVRGTMVHRALREGRVLAES
jgi:predicted nucleotidyltransferase